jgi:hypothetical protein
VVPQPEVVTHTTPMLTHCICCMHHTALCCAVLCCAVLCCAVLCRGLWLPNQKLDEVPAMSPTVLLSSSFAQEQYITLPAAQLASMPGTYMLQVSVLTGQTEGWRGVPGGDTRWACYFAAW